MLFYHKHSLATALIELFPNIGLDRTKFKFRQCMSFFISFQSFCFLFFVFCFLSNLFNRSLE